MDKKLYNTWMAITALALGIIDLVLFWYRFLIPVQEAPCLLQDCCSLQLETFSM